MWNMGFSMTTRMLTDWTVWGSNAGGVEIFRICPDQPWGPLSLLYDEYRVFPGGKERLRRDADPSPSSSAAVMKEYSYTSTSPMGRTACTESQCLHFTLPCFTRMLHL